METLIQELSDAIDNRKEFSFTLKSGVAAPAWYVRPKAEGTFLKGDALILTQPNRSFAAPEGSMVRHVIPLANILTLAVF